MYAAMKRLNSHPVLWLLFAALFALTLSPTSPSEGQRRPSRAPVPDDVPPRPENNTACNYQEPIPYLIRENFLPRWTQPPEEQQRRQVLQAQAVAFRTEHYGHFEGFGSASMNENAPTHYAERAEFMGLNVRLNAQITPTLACIEEQIRAECTEEPYTPVRLSGIRTRNTYHNSQVSNHVYGIAIDVDPQLNTCCMCVAQWGDHPLCQREVESIYERMAMPACWVHVFERFGFYWLGRDRLQDTMHFEFLGDPSHVLKTQGPAPHVTASGDAAEGAEVEAAAEGAEDEAAAGAENEAAAEGAEGESAEADAEAEAEPSAMEGTATATATTETNVATVEPASTESTESPQVAPESSGGCSVFLPGL